MIKHRTSRLWSLYFKLLPGDPHDTIISFGPHIFVPTSKPLSLQPDILVHEKTHLKQMHYSYFYGTLVMIGYLFIPSVRYKLELEAMAEQIRYVRSTCKDKSQVEAFTHQLARALSSESYKNMVPYEKAYEDLYAHSGQFYEKSYYDPRRML